MTRIARHFVVLAAAAIMAPGCASKYAPRSASSVGTEEAVVQVSNQHWSDMTIYVIQGNGSRQRLGTVTSFTERNFKLPRHLVDNADVRLLADPIGSSRTHTSPPLLVGRGQVLVWRLENSISMSSAFVRSR